MTEVELCLHLFSMVKSGEESSEEVQPVSLWTGGLRLWERPCEGEGGFSMKLSLA